MENQPDLQKVKQYVLNRLEHELPPALTYHAIEHTVKEAVPAADLLASMENVGEENHLLVLTAAYFHDLGFIYQRQDHELISIQIAEQILPDFGYSAAQIEVIRGIILATCLPQSPTNLLEQIMADSDLDYLGLDDYWRRSADFRQELGNYGRSFSDDEWYVYQLNFMEAHRYFTASARKLREPQKQEHIREVRKLYEQLVKENISHHSVV